MSCLILLLILSTALLLTLGMFRQRMKKRLAHGVFGKADHEDVLSAVLGAVKHGLLAINANDESLLLHNRASQEMANRLGLTLEQLASEIAEHAPSMKSMNIRHGKMAEEVRIHSANDSAGLTLSVDFSFTRHSGTNVLVASFQEYSDKKFHEDIGNLEHIGQSILKPLNTMIGNMAIIDTGMLTEDQRQRWEYASLALEEIQRQATGIIDYCSLAKENQPIVFNDFDACDMLERKLSSLARLAASHNLKIHVRQTRLSIVVHHDQAKISKIIGHLLKKTMQDNRTGNIFIRAEHHDLDEQRHLLRIIIQDASHALDISLTEDPLNHLHRGSGLSGEDSLESEVCRKLCEKLQIMHFSWTDARASNNIILDIPFAPLKNYLPQENENELPPACVIFISPSAETHGNIIPHLVRWGLQVSSVYHPDDATLSQISEAACVIIFDANPRWAAASENRIIENARCIIDCNFSNPPDIRRIGRSILLPNYSLSKIFNALHEILDVGYQATHSWISSHHVDSGGSHHPAVVQEAFKISLRESLNSIKESVPSKNSVLIMTELHNLSGSLAAFGFKDLSRKCISLEQSIKTNGLPPSLHALDDLTQLLTMI